MTFPSHTLKVAYDGQAFLSPMGGTGKGTQLRNLLGSRIDEFVGFATKGRNYSNVSLIQGGWPRYQLWQQLSLPLFINKWKPDYFLAPYNTAPLFVPSPTKLILVLHDMIMFEQYQSADVRSKVLAAWRRSLTPLAVSRAYMVVTVSAYSKEQILKRFPKARVEVIPCSIAPSWFVDAEEPKLRVRSNAILMVTGNAPHKNMDRALAAYAAYAKSHERNELARLKIVGVPKSKKRLEGLARTLGVADLVDVEPFLEEQQLQELYRRSKAFLFPSLLEGFGIPMLEAMASGTPVISSNAASIPEVGGAAPFYFDPTDVNAIAAAIGKVLGDQAMQRSMVERGLERAQRYHPDIVSAQVQAFWHERASSLLDESPRQRAE